MLADLSLRPEARALRDEHIESRPGKGRALFIKTDVVQWPDLERMFELAEETFGQVDIVCPGAGVFEPHWSNFWYPPGSAEARDSAEGAPDGVGHYALIDINLTHPVRTTQLAVQRWLHPQHSKAKATPTNPKRILHISSIAGQAPSFTVPLYAASKAAISSFVRSLAELERVGIRVNGVAPGVIKTPLWLEHPEKMLMLSQEQDSWIEAADVAVQMLRCIEDDKIGAGTILEVLKGSTRKVDWRMDPGPSGKDGGTTSNASVARARVWETLL